MIFLVTTIHRLKSEVGESFAIRKWLKVFMREKCTHCIMSPWPTTWAQMVRDAAASYRNLLELCQNCHYFRCPSSFFTPIDDARPASSVAITKLCLYGLEARSIHENNLTGITRKGFPYILQVINIFFESSILNSLRVRLTSLIIVSFRNWSSLTSSVQFQW